MPINIEANDLIEAQQAEINSLTSRLMVQTALANRVIRELNSAKSKIEAIERSPAPDAAGA